MNSCHHDYGSWAGGWGWAKGGLSVTTQSPLPQALAHPEWEGSLGEAECGGWTRPGMAGATQAC